MNRRLNSVLFLAGATFLNILLLFFYYLAFMGVTGLLLPNRTGWVEVSVFVGILLAALAAGWFSYRWIFRILKDRINLDRYLDFHLFKGLF